MTIRETPLQPFGVLLRPGREGRYADELPADVLDAAVLRHRLVLLRGFATMEEQRYVAFCRRFGALLEWDFGVLLNVRKEARPANHLFSDGRVELHWDGAFAAQTPRLNVFQCLSASGPGTEGGATLFADGAGVLAQAGERERVLWEAIDVDYVTAKKAHYGGAVRSRLVQRHPVTGEAALRLIEPFNEDNMQVNPVQASVPGWEEDNSRRLLQDLVARLYRPRHLYRHQWQPGDVLLVDNHALLHGRERLGGNVARHLQRVHVL
jgi:alpha-ketoglutarate-dependent taurine dioxygenase